MAFRLIDGDWHRVMREAAKADRSALRVVCPFIKLSAARKLIEAAQAKSIQVITRYKLQDFYEGASDVSALRLFLNYGAEIRGVRGLHAKLFLFGKSSALVTSANLTLAALQSNHELGFLSDDEAVVRQCRRYFDDLWERAGVDSLSTDTLDQWDRKLSTAWSFSGPKARPKGLRDEGVDAGLQEELMLGPDRVADAPQAFVKFFGTNQSRSDWDDDILLRVKRAGCHWACTYGKRPKQVQNGALMFMSSMTRSPKDFVIFGWAIGQKHVAGIDEASPADIAKRKWKRKWPFYVRVHHPEFIRGPLKNGIALSTLKEKFGADSFASTQRNKRAGRGNTDPNRAYMNKAQVLLSDEAAAWLKAELESRFRKYGKYTRQSKAISKLDWPKVRATEEE